MLFGRICPCDICQRFFERPIKDARQGASIVPCTPAQELNYFEQIYHHRWATEMKDLLTRAIKLKDTMSPGQYTGSFDQRTAVINKFDILTNQTLPDTVPKCFLSKSD